MDGQMLGGELVFDGQNGFFPPWMGAPAQNPGRDTFCVQSTPSDRSKCSACSGTISLDSVRFGIWTPRFASIVYSIWRYKHVECVTFADIKAAVENYGSVEDIPSVKYYVRGEDREECNEILSGILNGGGTDESDNEDENDQKVATKEPVEKEPAAKKAPVAKKKVVAKKATVAKKKSVTKKGVTKKRPSSKKSASTKSA